MMKAGMRDVDDVENAERDRHAGGHRGVEAADQHARDDGIDEQIERKHHTQPLMPARECAGSAPLG